MSRGDIVPDPFMESRKHRRTLQIFDSSILRVAVL
jgi:hypothetical protein